MNQNASSLKRVNSFLGEDAFIVGEQINHGTEFTAIVLLYMTVGSRFSLAGRNLHFSPTVLGYLLSFEEPKRGQT